MVIGVFILALTMCNIRPLVVVGMKYRRWSIVTSFIRGWVKLIRLHVAEGFLRRLWWTPIHLWNRMGSETYEGISDAPEDGTSTGNRLGVQYVLHSRFTGGRRYMVQNYQDDMAVCRQFGSPDLFWNRKWQEIVDALGMEPGQIPSDCPYIITRVFGMKRMGLSVIVRLALLLAPLIHFCMWWVSKEGSPYTHILVLLKEEASDAMSVFINSFVTVEIHLGYALIEEFMMHGPCGGSNTTCPMYEKWSATEYSSCDAISKSMDFFSHVDLLYCAQQFSPT